MKRIILTLGALSLGTTTAATAFAQDTARVPYRVAELATSEGRDLLARRVERAIARVCGAGPITGSLLRYAGEPACRRAAGEAARLQMDRAIARANGTTEVASVGRR